MTHRREHAAVPGRHAAAMVLRGVLLAAVLVLPACAARSTPPLAPRTQPSPAPAAVPPAVVAAPAQAAVNPGAGVLAASAEAEARGRRELADGHVREARLAFDDALDVLITAPAAVRALPQVADRTRQLIERVSALEIEALGREADAVPSDVTPLDTVLAAPTFTPPSSLTTERATGDATRHDIEIPLNSRVLSYIELYTGRLKGFLEESLARGSQYLPMIQRVFASEGLPTDLAFVPIVESAFKPTAMSRAKARGLWQFMRGTAVENGLKHDWYVDERAEPEQATRAAARYLKTLYEMFGDWHLALASYNAGPGRVQRALTRSGKPDFWSLTSSSRFLPRETRDYVPLILAAAVVGRNPEQYGLHVPNGAIASEPDTISITAPVDLRRLAEAIERPVDELKALNPALRRWATPPNVETFALRVPAGTGAQVTEFLSGSDADQDSPYVWYTSKKGDTVAGVARRLKVARRDLRDANFLKTGARLRPGQRLIVPRQPGVVPARPSRPVEPAPTLLASRERAVVPARAEVKPVVHRVRRGETLGSIARRYRTTVDDIRRHNKLSGTAIKVGDRLTIRPRR